MNSIAKVCGLLAVFAFLTAEDCEGRPMNTTAKDEQAATEMNQRGLLTTQPPPRISWSLERDNLIKRFKLMNDRSVMFYMYVFIEGVAEPLGYYQINKVSSVDSQLTNPSQIVWAGSSSGAHVVPSPAEDGSYGTNGTGIFGFTPDDIYIEHDLHYIVSTVPLTFKQAVQRLVVVDASTAAEVKGLMDRVRKTNVVNGP